MTERESSKNPAPNVGAEINDASQWLAQYARVNAELLQSAIKSATPVLTAWASFYQNLLPVQMQPAQTQAQTKTSGKPVKTQRGRCREDRSCCEIPETDCPPRCACSVCWEASAGERRTASIRIRNTSKDSVVYSLSAKPFECGGKTSPVSPVVVPESITAAPGQTVQATIAVGVGEEFQPGSVWHSEVLVSGKYQRCVKVELCIRCDEDECHFDLGDIPYRKKADQWYRHFQCSEPCFEPVSSQQPPGRTVGSNAESQVPAGS